MTRSANVSVQNNFVQGLITEATTLNFPQNACTDAENVVFSRIGDVTRRLGFDFETNNSTNTGVNVQGDVIVSYLWKAPAGQGNLNIVVVQIGNTLYFYTQNPGTPLSSNLSVNTINLDTLSVYNWGTAAGPGWNSSNSVSNIWSTSAVAITSGGTATFTVQAGLPVQTGQTVVASGGATTANSMTGTVSSYNSTSGSLVLNVTGHTGSGTIGYWTFVATASSGATQGTECQFSSGNGYLFVAHEFCNPFYVTYDPVALTFTATSIPIRTRDFKGIPSDGTTSITQRPTSLSAAHRYNLANQGWSSPWLTTSSTSLTVAVGSKTWSLNNSNPLPIQLGDRLRIWSGTAPTGIPVSGYPTGGVPPSNQCLGTVTTYSFATTTWSLTLNIDVQTGSPNTNSWTIMAEPNHIDWWNWSFAQTTSATSQFPSNADNWTYYCLPPTGTGGGSGGINGLFDVNATIGQNIPPNTQANQGHFILDPFFEDRSTASGNTGLTINSTVAERPQAVAFYEGRTWFAGTNAQGFNARIYFSQIVTPNNSPSSANYANCYQQEDPTNPNFFDLLPSDGGVLDILDAGTIYKMVPVLNSLVIFAANGVWAITGSQGTGFRANDYAVHKISSVYQIGSSSFVDVDGIPYWWNFEGIYRVTLNPTSNALRVESISLTTIKSFMDNIPEESLQYARGSFDPEAKIVQWLFRSTNSSDTFTRYSFDSVLNFNTLSNAFYPWTIDTSVNINGVVSLPSQIGNFVTNTVIDGSGDSVVSTTSGTPQLITLDAVSSSTGFAFYYLCTSGIQTSANVSFAQNLSDAYVDWFSLDSAGQPYTSYFITGFMIKGATQSRWQTNYVRMWTNPESQSTFQVQSFWNYNQLTGSGILPQTVVVPANSKPRRFKLRGNGLITQFKVTSFNNEPFDIQGWSSFETTSQWV